MTRRSLKIHHWLRHASEKEPAADKSRWSFAATNTGVALQWCLIAHAGTGYIRELLRITATGADLPVAEIRMLDFTGDSAQVSGSVKGSPTVDRNMFFGIEHPLSISTVADGRVRALIFRDLALRADQLSRTPQY